MKLLERYIAKNVISSIAMVTLMLVGLQVFILFVNQLDSLGKVNFGILQATLFICLQTPYQVYLFFPMASLLGALIGLGLLANHSELIVMRAAGMSILQISIAVLKAALLLVIFVTLLGESIIPKLAQIGNEKKAQALSEGHALLTAQGIWIRYQDDFINISNTLENNTLLNVYQFHFTADHQLNLARKIKQIQYKNKVWHAFDIEQTLFQTESTSVEHINEMVWDIPLKPSILQIGKRAPDEMTLKELYQYLQAQKKMQQIPLNYKLAFWQRVIQPLTTLVMILLAIPFIFGPLRSSSMGTKLLTGATVGFGFHIINRFFGPMSQVLQLPPIIAGLGPTLIFAGIGLYLMRKTR